MTVTRFTTVLLAVAVCLYDSARGDTASEVLAMTGGRQTKAAWIRVSHESPPKQWTHLSYNGGVLMGFDTAEGKERVIVSEPAKCWEPRLTSDGKRVVFAGPERTLWVVDWDGKNLKKVMQGEYYFPVGTWQDPSGTDWVYVGNHGWSKEEGTSLSNLSGGTSIVKFKLDDPSVRELVWDKTHISNASVGPDGKSMAGELPHPNMGVAKFPNVGWTLYGNGCNPNLAPDGSGRFFFMLGGHKHIRLFGPEGPESGDTRVAVSTMKDEIKDDSWRPRWTNDVRFLSIQSGDYGQRANVYIGRFDEEFTWIEQWVRISNSGEYDADPIVWIQPESKGK